MGLFTWFTPRTGPDRRLAAWRAAWTLAAAEPGAGAAAALRERLEALRLPEDEIEVEREMLEGLNAAAELARTLDAAGLPAIATGHRIVGRDVCHFTAPASMPDDPLQPSGRLILTGARAIFVGGRGLTVPWHTVDEARHTARDLLLVGHGAGSVSRFRCNSFADAMCAALLARRILRERGVRTPGAL